MADYVNCPACHGQGVLPLEEAQRLEATAQAGAGDQARAAWEHRVAMVQLDNELRQRTAEQRTKDAEDRMRRLEEAAGERS